MEWLNLPTWLIKCRSCESLSIILTEIYCPKIQNSIWIGSFSQELLLHLTETRGSVLGTGRLPMQFRV